MRGKRRATQPKHLVKAWVDAFNRADVEALAALYSDDAINHRVAEGPVKGREAIAKMFAADFAAADMVLIVENIFQDGEWAILEWRDPLGLPGCGFFRVVRDKIVFQRGDWDKLSFLRLYGLDARGLKLAYQRVRPEGCISPVGDYLFACHFALARPRHFAPC